MQGRRRLKLLAVWAALILAIGACSDGASSESTTSGSSTTSPDSGSTAASEPTSSTEPSPEMGSVVVGRVGDIDGVDPHVLSLFQTKRTLELVYDTLVDLDAELNVVPALAESWEFSDDAQTLTFRLRDGVSFQDGDEFSSEDVVDSLERILDEDTGAAIRANFTDIVSVEAPDPATVVVTLAQPNVALLAAFTDIGAAILSSENIADGSIETTPAGTGAFEWSSWEPGEAVTLVASSDWWGSPVGLSELVFRVIPDETALVAAMRAGEVDIAEFTDPVVVSQITDADLDVQRTPALAYHALMLNTDASELGSKDVRQAMSCAVDRQTVVDTAALGEASVTGPIPIPSFKSPPDGLPCGGTRNVQEATRLLEAAGLPDGFSFTAIVMSDNYATAVPNAESLQAQLAEVGIDMQIEQLETGTYVDRWLAGDYEAAVALNSGRVDPHDLYARFWRSDGQFNFLTGFSSDELDSLMDAGRAETDPAARVQIYDDFSELLQDESPWLWLYTGYEYRVVADSVEGFVGMPNGSYLFLRQTTNSG